MALSQRSHATRAVPIPGRSPGREAVCHEQPTRNIFAFSGSRAQGSPMVASRVPKVSSRDVGHSVGTSLARPARHMHNNGQGEGFESLGPAMRFVLLLARHRTGDRQELPSGDDLEPVRAAFLWELAERYHPEHVWLAESWLRHERTLGDLEKTGPRGDLAPALAEAARTNERFRPEPPPPPRMAERLDQGSQVRNTCNGAVTQTEPPADGGARGQ